MIPGAIVLGLSNGNGADDDDDDGTVANGLDGMDSTRIDYG